MLLQLAPGFDVFFGNLFHLNAEQQPEDPDYPRIPSSKRGSARAACCGASRRQRSILLLSTRVLARGANKAERIPARSP